MTTKRMAWRTTVAAAQEHAGAAVNWFNDAYRHAAAGDLIDCADSIRIGTQCANLAHQFMQQALREREAAMFPPHNRKLKVKR